MTRRVRLYAHRGAAIELPENTMPAFARAVEIGVDALEMDAHLSRDGEVVISHDGSGKRMCGVDREIKKCDLAEIREWNAASTFRDRDEKRYAGSALSMPTLDEVLSDFPRVIINLDLKQHSPSMVEPTLDIIRAHRAEGRVILASFYQKTLLEVRRFGYGGLTALPRAELLAFLGMPRWIYKRLPLRGNAAQLPVEVGPFDFGRKYIIDKCHDAGLRADYWTVNDPVHARKLLELGADGIMTDDPAAIFPVFEAFRGA